MWLETPACHQEAHKSIPIINVCHRYSSLYKTVYACLQVDYLTLMINPHTWQSALCLFHRRLLLYSSLSFPSNTLIIFHQPSVFIGFSLFTWKLPCQIHPPRVRSREPKLYRPRLNSRISTYISWRKHSQFLFSMYLWVWPHRYRELQH